MANYLVTDTELIAIANKIREKTGTVGGIEFTNEFISEIEKLTDTRDADAVAGDIRYGKTAYVNKNKLTGSIPVKGAGYVNINGNVVTIPAGIYDNESEHTVGTAKSAATYNVSSSDQTIASGQYLSGTQTIKGVTTENIIAGNIKNGVVVKVGDSNNAGRIKNITGTAKQKFEDYSYNNYFQLPQLTNITVAAGAAKVIGQTFISASESNDLRIKTLSSDKYDNLIFYKVTFVTSPTRGFNISIVLHNTTSSSILISSSNRVYFSAVLSRIVW